MIPSRVHCEVDHGQTLILRTVIGCITGADCVGATVGVPRGKAVSNTPGATAAASVRHVVCNIFEGGDAWAVVWAQDSYICLGHIDSRPQYRETLESVGAHAVIL